MERVSEVRICLVVPKLLVKKIKDTLQAVGTLERSTKIRPYSNDEKTSIVHSPKGLTSAGAFYIPTTIRVQAQDIGNCNQKNLALWTGMQDHQTEIGFVISVLPTIANGADSSISNIKANDSLLLKTVENWLGDFPREDRKQSDTPGQKTLSTTEALPCSWTYMIYPPLLLLPPSTFLSSSIFLRTESLSNRIPSLHNTLCEVFKVTHIALNAPIPANQSEQLTANEDTSPKKADHKRCQGVSQFNSQPVPNVLRSPTGLTPIHGNFGPACPLDHCPTPQDFASAFWCTSRQNGIFQTWAPRYTMFSRGNISEKFRILNLESLTEQRLGMNPKHTTAVDLYAGIGYFAFSYAKAGVGKVLCWEINPWSVEGLRRGAGGNKWSVKLMEAGTTVEDNNDDQQRIVVFPESNEHAMTRIEAIRDKISPIKHVNCGLLPSSRDSWHVAVQVLDTTGGWIHVHENIARKDIESSKEEIVEIFGRLAKLYRNQEPPNAQKVECERVELVKSYAPGVMHCVLDIAVSTVDHD